MTMGQRYVIERMESNRALAVLERAHLYLRAQHNQCSFYFPLSVLGSRGGWISYNDALCILESAIAAVKGGTL